MGQTMRRPLRWGAGSVGAAAVMLALPAVGLGSPKFTASNEVKAIVNVHNAYGDTFQTYYWTTLGDANTGDQNWCDGLRDTQDADWSSYDNQVAQDEGLIKDFTVFNQDVLGWVTTLEKFRPPKKQKAARNLFDKAAKLMRQAHDKHAKEIFHLSGAIADLRAHNCDTASSERSAAAPPGRLAWSDEYLALHEFARAFKVKLSDLNWPPGDSPYDQAPS